MANTVTEFHEIAARMLAVARAELAARPKPGEIGYLNQASQDATTVWRRTAHLLSDYANKEQSAPTGSDTPGWGAFWGNGADELGFSRLLARRTRFARCDVDGSASLLDDSVIHWEYDLALELVSSESPIVVARKMGSAGTLRRTELEHEVTMNVAAAYTGLPLGDLREALLNNGGELPSYGYRNGGRSYSDHSVFNLITANRPTI